MPNSALPIAPASAISTEKYNKDYYAEGEIAEYVLNDENI